MTYTITPLIGEKAIAARVRELAASIDADMGTAPMSCSGFWREPCPLRPCWRSI